MGAFCVCGIVLLSMLHTDRAFFMVGVVAGVVILTTGHAAVTYRYVELPAMRRKVRTGAGENS